MTFVARLIRAAGPRFAFLCLIFLVSVRNGVSLVQRFRRNLRRTVRWQGGHFQKKKKESGKKKNKNAESFGFDGQAQHVALHHHIPSPYSSSPFHIHHTKWLPSVRSTATSATQDQPVSSFHRLAAWQSPQHVRVELSAAISCRIHTRTRMLTPRSHLCVDQQALCAAAYIGLELEVVDTQP